VELEWGGAGNPELTEAQSKEQSTRNQVLESLALLKSKPLLKYTTSI